MQLAKGNGRAAWGGGCMGRGGWVGGLVVVGGGVGSRERAHAHAARHRQQQQAGSRAPWAQAAMSEL